MINNKILNIFLFLSFFYSPMISYGMSDQEITLQQENRSFITIIGYDLNNEEVDKLPRYLQDKIRYHYYDTHPNFKKWESALGKEYHHLHHHAIGIILMDRIKSQPENKKKYLNEANGHFSYVIRNSSNLPVLYDVYARRGDTFLEMGDIRSAVKDYTVAMKLKPDYVYAYLRLSECYSRLGMKKEADEIMRMMQELRLKNSAQ